MTIPDAYVHVHKGLRSLISEVILEAGATDWADSSAVSKVQEKWAMMYRLLYAHHQHETEFIHPLLARIVPGGARQFETEHASQVVVLDDLEGHIRHLASGQNQPERQQAIGAEFYRGLAMFYSQYLPHLHREEEWAQRTLEALCTPEEISDALIRTIASIPPEEAMKYLLYMIPAMNIWDCELFLRQVKEGGPPEMLEALAGIVQQHRSEDDWNRLRALIGMGE